VALLGITEQEWKDGRGEECCTVLHRLLVALVDITKQEWKDRRGEECLDTSLSLSIKGKVRVLAISLYNRKG
jgi:hypothetical protein